MVNVASELANNQRLHARDGVVVFRRVERDGVSGLEIVAADRGEGIADPTAALAGVSTGASLGAGLSAVREFSDEVDIDVRLGEGSCVWARKFQQPVRRRREVGIVGRPHPGERVSGDHAGFRRTSEQLLLAVADGLGHGPHARRASSAAIRAAMSQGGAELDTLLLEAHGALHDTRGAVMAAARVHEKAGQVDVAAVGNITVEVRGPRQAQRFGGSSFTLGVRGRLPRVWSESATLTPWDAVVLFSDGVSSRADLGVDTSLLLEHPVVMAHQILLRFAVEHDDVVVLVAR